MSSSVSYPLGKPSAEWPSREEWAKRHRTLYADEDIRVSTAAADYASPEEIAAAIAEAKALWTDMGRQMKAAGHAISDADWRRRFRTASREERDQLLASPEMDYVCIRDDRSDLNRHIIKPIDEGELPLGRGLATHRLLDRLPKIQELLARYRAAWDQELARKIAERAARPVDDVAWEDELKRRASIEAYLAGDRFCHRVA